MPLITLKFESGAPIIEAYIGVSRPKADALTAAGLVIPNIVKVRLLIDTGASGTCIDPTCLAPLGLVATGSVPIQTPSTNGVPLHCAQYDVMIAIPGPAGAPHILDALPIIESGFQTQGIDGLLGRDVLSACSLHYNGPIGLYTLAY